MCVRSLFWWCSMVWSSLAWPYTKTNCKLPTANCKSQDQQSLSSCYTYCTGSPTSPNKHKQSTNFPKISWLLLAIGLQSFILTHLPPTIKEEHAVLSLSYTSEQTADHKHRKGWYMKVGRYQRYSFSRQAEAPELNLIYGTRVSTMTGSSVCWKLKWMFAFVFLWLNIWGTHSTSNW